MVEDRDTGKSEEQKHGIHNGSPEAPLADSAEIADLKDQLLRALAEQRNILQRAQREVREAAKFGASTLARDLLTTVDNLRRAIDSVPPQKVDNEHIKSLLAGIIATEQALLEAFKKHSILPIDAYGKHFDPNIHEAIFEVAESDHPAGTVVEVIQPGFLHHDRLLRPAAVVVAKSTQSSGSCQKTGTPTGSPMSEKA